MAVPDTNTFTLDDVRLEVDASKNNLNDLITVANAQSPSEWDPNYMGSKNSLLNFRNYGNTINVTSFQLSLASSDQSSGACSLSLATKQTLYFNGTTTYPTIGKTIYTDSSLTTTFNGGYDWYKTGNGANKFQISFAGVVNVIDTCP